MSFKHVLSDIETLNQKAREGVYDLTAISYHAYPYVVDKYVLMASGSSIGDSYGPMLVANPSSHWIMSENAVNIALTGAAWVVADSLVQLRR